MRHRRLTLVLTIVAVAVVFGIGAKRRSVRTGSCTVPTLTLTVGPQTACATDPVTLSWRASDFRATVAIEGVGDTLSASGSTRILDSRPRTFTGYAKNTCGRGPDRSVSVNTPTAPAGSLFAPASLKQHTSGTLRVDGAGATFWTLRSSLSNPINPSSGFDVEEVTYTASNSGTDGVLLTLHGQCGITTSRTATIVVEATSAPPPPPPPPGGGGFLRCCDNTFSKTCTSCANKQGCCSSHGGVCGC